MAEEKIRLEDIAEHFHVSVSTVSRALTGKGRISEDLRGQIRDYAVRNRYQRFLTGSGARHSASGNPAVRKTGNVGVLIPTDVMYESDFFKQCLMGIASYLSGAGYYTLILLGTSGDPYPVRHAIEDGRIDGMILTRTIRDDPTLEYLEHKHFPTVTIGLTKANVCQVDADNTAACRELTSYLVGTGCTRIAFLCGETQFYVNEDRYEGYVRGLADRGIQPDPSLITKNVTTREGVQHGLEKALYAGAKGIICGDDVICSQVMDLLEDRGVRVPENMLVASCYNSPQLESHNPKITAINCDPIEEGRVAGKAMAMLLQGEKTGTRIQAEYNVLLRQSTRWIG